jgi:hypothetical protein
MITCGAKKMQATDFSAESSAGSHPLRGLIRAVSLRLSKLCSGAVRRVASLLKRSDRCAECPMSQTSALVGWGCGGCRGRSRRMEKNEAS